MPTKTRSQSQSHDSGLEEEPGGASSAFAPVSPSVQDAHSEASLPLPSAEWTAERERAAKEAYDTEVADYQIYDVMRKFASSMRALALYDCRFCLSELEKLPHQHYELGQYSPVSQLPLEYHWLRALTHALLIVLQ